MSRVPCSTPCFRALRATIVAAGVTLALVGAPGRAEAGTYTISGTCGLWEPFSVGASGITAFPNCPELWARNLGGAFSTPPGGAAGWVFHAPAGTWITGFSLQG